MKWYRPAAFVVMLVLAVPAAAIQPPQRTAADRAPGTSSIERWVRQLESEIDHLQEDVYYERGTYPAGLGEQVEQASRAVSHFHRMLRTSDREHLMRDFEEMDREIHQLVDRLNQSGDRWLRRQASRIRYADEQLHYALRTDRGDGPAVPRELLARHAHLLENEAKSLQRLAERVGRREDRVRDAIEEFAEEAEHFHQVVEQGADLEHLREDFRDVDEAWRRAVGHLNQSSYRFYLRRRAQDVNRVQDQIHRILERGQQRRGEVPVPRRRAEPRGRPSIEFDIPGVGRFRIPR